MNSHERLLSKDETAGAMVVDDDPITCQLMSNMLRRFGYNVRTACAGADAFFQFQRCPCGLVLTDYKMDVINGYQLGRRIKFQFPETQVIIMTGIKRHLVAALMTDESIDGWLFKPFNADDLRALLSRIGQPAVAVETHAKMK